MPSNLSIEGVPKGYAFWAPLMANVSHMKTCRIAISIAFLALFGCSHAPSPTSPEDLGDLGDRLFRSGCPSVTAIVEKKVTNQHDPSVTDTIKTISCDGLEMQIYIGVTASDPNGLPIYLEVLKPNATLPRYMNIGESRRGLVAVLGKPSKQKDHAITYYMGESYDSVTFSVYEGRIKSVRWDWYND